MSDEEVFQEDDAEWGNDGEGGDGDDGWGDGGDDAWDDAVEPDFNQHIHSSHEHQDPSANQSPNAQSPDEVKIQIENLYYMAEGNHKRSPQQALQQYQQCYDLEVNQEAEFEFFMRFKALTAIIMLQYQLGLRKEMLKNYSQLLQYASTNHVSRNDSNDAVNSVLNLASEEKENVSDGGFSQELYALTLEHLKSQGGISTQRLYFSISMKLCRKYLESSQFAKAEALLTELHNTCKNSDGSDDKSKGSQLLEIYAMQVQLLSAQGDSFRLKELFERTRNLNDGINDPRSMSIIQECWGKTYGNEGNWDQAFKEFWEAFLAYQQIGSSRAKQCLKYVVIANMLSSQPTNPFSSREAKVYEHDPEIAAMVKLQRAYDENDVRNFQQILNLNHSVLLDDPFIFENIEPLLQQIRSQTLMISIKPYNRVKLSSLASGLNITVEELSNLLVQLILDSKISGKIDQVNGFLEIGQESNVERKYNAIDSWASKIERLSTNMGSVQIQQT